MTIPNANSEYPNSAAYYAPQTHRPSAMDTGAPRFSPLERSPMEPLQPLGAATGTVPTSPTLDLPYELELGGREGTPQLTLYRPSPQRVALPQLSPTSIPAAEMPGGQENGDGAKTMEEIEEETGCPVCENRKYQDGSDDPGVSLKFATKLNPHAATAAIRAHEYQHVRRHQMEADKQDRKIISQTVMLRTRRCPCCGKMYTAGGTTKTVTAACRDYAQSNAQAEGKSLNACV